MTLREHAEELWAAVYAFTNMAGICQRSDEWHESEPCETCQGVVDFVRQREEAAEQRALREAAEAIKQQFVGVVGNTRRHFHIDSVVEWLVLRADSLSPAEDAR